MTTLREFRDGKVAEINRRMFHQKAKIDLEFIILLTAQFLDMKEYSIIAHNAGEILKILHDSCAYPAEDDEENDESE